MATRHEASTVFKDTLKRLDLNGASKRFEYPFPASVVEDLLSLQNLVLQQTYHNGKDYTLLTKTVAAADLATCFSDLDETQTRKNRMSQPSSSNSRISTYATADTFATYKTLNTSTVFK